MPPGSSGPPTPPEALGPTQKPPSVARRTRQKKRRPSSGTTQRLEPRAPTVRVLHRKLPALCGGQAERPKLMQEGVGWVGGPRPSCVKVGETAVKRCVEEAQSVATLAPVLERVILCKVGECVL
eukprot:CAMPEP_0172061604 /NCGR_PEP_ID=MMETSP1043-20130122/8580_1 /TAXON_ID=464988 /ORGANISM="Hemiselmis andersenii, Strain CCMP441" /LENGTH=123 /DNA_ID=CAMNT_0012721435 /DNA_START=148 /DNA_END=520 /DNA_ORIENTATION=+